MRDRIMLALTPFALLGATPLLGACNTIAGAGEDIPQAGMAIKKAAVRYRP
jgi:predicted small secreted protein